MLDQNVKEAIEYALSVLKHTSTCNFQFIYQDPTDCSCGVTIAKKKLEAVLCGTVKFEVGDKVRVKRTAGFHKGATGVIKYIQPDDVVWIRRAGSSSDVWYAMNELELL